MSLEGMQQIGVADQYLRPGVAENVGNFIRLEVPVDRHRVSAKHHRCISCFDEGDIIAHQDADAVARLDAELLQAAGDARRALRDIGVASPSLAADDAMEEV